MNATNTVHTHSLKLCEVGFRGIPAMGIWKSATDPKSIIDGSVLFWSRNDYLDRVVSYEYSNTYLNGYSTEFGETMLWNAFTDLKGESSCYRVRKPVGDITKLTIKLDQRYYVWTIRLYGRPNNKELVTGTKVYIADHETGVSIYFLDLTLLLEISIL